ncbi:type I iodothyronine deiodinase-like isoform X1 [Babylonia areolata]|uniref:type I iodothyronine deiodinase-like isoform X1 n=1 Tax=Babylonia areolata TaxID=304850 RepID=UPI003FD4EF51
MTTTMKETVVFCVGFVGLLWRTVMTIAMMAWWRLTTKGRNSLRQLMNSVLAETALKEEDYVDSVFSFAHVKNVFHADYVELWRQARMHGPAPNPVVVTLTGHRQPLLTAMKAGRPLVLGFGSCS